MRAAGILFAAHFILQVGIGLMQVAVDVLRQESPAQKPNEASE